MTQEEIDNLIKENETLRSTNTELESQLKKATDDYEALKTEHQAIISNGSNLPTNETKEDPFVALFKNII